MKVIVTKQNYHKLISVYNKFADILYPVENIESTDKLEKIKRLYEPINTDNEEFLSHVKWAESDTVVSAHAKQRFEERYNIPWDDNFLNYVDKAIKQTSINRKGHIVKNDNRCIYRVIYKNKIVEFVKATYKDGSYSICTFNSPPENINDICYSYRREKDGANKSKI